MSVDFDRSVDEIAGTCIAVRLRLLNRALSKVYDDALRPLKLKVSQMNILVATAKLGVARPAEMCEILQLSVSTLSRNLDRMKANDWIEVLDDHDGRAHPFRLTKTGEALLAKAYPAWAKAQSSAEAILGGDFVRELQEVTKDLKKFR